MFSIKIYMSLLTDFQALSKKKKKKKRQKKKPKTFSVDCLINCRNLKLSRFLKITLPEKQRTVLHTNGHIKE